VAIVSSASVKITPDLSSFRRELESGLRSIKAEIQVAVQLNKDKAAAELKTWVAKESRETISKKVDLDTKSLRKGLGDLGPKIASFTSSMLLSLSAASSLLPVVGGIGAALASASGAAGLLPAALLGGVGILAAIKLGADGAKAAFEGLNPTLDAMKSKVSASFKDSLLPAVENLKSALPPLTGGFQQIATAMGGVLTKVTIWMKTPAATEQLNTILSATSRVVQNIGAFLQPVIAAFVRIGAVAAPILVELTSGLGNVGQRFNEWIQALANSGELEAWIRTGIDAFKTFFSYIGMLGDIVGSVFKALAASGASVGGIIGPMIQTVRDFLASGEGQSALIAVFQGLEKVGAAVGSILKAALDAVGPLIPPLAQAIGDLAGQIASVLIPVILFLAPVLQNIATFIQQNTSWLGPLAIAIGVATIAMWAFNAAMAANPITLVILAIGALIAIVATIITYWQPIAAFFTNLWNTVVAAVTTAAQWIWQRLVDAWNFIVGVWSGVVGWFQGIWDGIVAGVSAAASWVGNLFSGAWEFIKGIWSAVTGWFASLWNAYVAGVSAAIDRVKSFFSGAWEFVKGVWSAVGGFFAGVWNSFTSGVSNALNTVKGWFSSAWENIKSVWSAVGGFFSGVWNSITNGLKGPLNAAIRILNGAISGMNLIPGVNIPKIPYLAEGGVLSAGGTVMVGERGPEMLTLPRGAQVTPLAGRNKVQLGGDSGGEGNGVSAETLITALSQMSWKLDPQGLVRLVSTGGQVNAVGR